MGVAIKFRRGTATEHASFEGEAAEVTVQTNTTGLPWSLRVHDGDRCIWLLDSCNRRCSYSSK